MKVAVSGKKHILMIVLIAVWMLVLGAVFINVLTDKADTGENRLPVYMVENSDNRAAITFNCAWTDEGTDELLEILKRNNIKSTFFLVGTFAEKYPETVRKIKNAGHELGNHSMEHSDPKKEDFSETLSDISACNEVINSITGVTPVLYRAPSGSYDSKTIEAAESLGMTAVQWNVDSVDWKNISPAKITERVVSKTVPGSIILFHLGRKNTIEALPQIIKKLKSENYTFCSVDDILIDGDTYVNFQGIQKKSP